MSRGIRVEKTRLASHLAWEKNAVLMGAGGVVASALAVSNALMGLAFASPSTIGDVVETQYAGSTRAVRKVRR
jgi:hypothetical protein